MRDTRDPTRLVPFNILRKAEDLPVDWMSMVSMLLGLAGLLLRVRPLSRPRASPL